MSVKETSFEATHPADTGAECDTEHSPAELSALQSTKKPPLPLSRSIPLVLVIVSSSFLNTAVTQACVIILPTIGRDLDIPSGSLQWVLTAMSLTYACTLPLWGRIADIWGRRFIFQLGLASICISCIVTPFAPGEVSFDVFRAFQGLGGAAATPSAVGIIFGVFPPGRGRIYAMSAFSAGFPLGNVIGNILGGIIAQSLHWHWIFWIMSIVAACACGTSLFVIPPLAKDIELQNIPLQKRIQKLGVEMDWVGLLVSTVMLFFFLVSLNQGNLVGWTSPWVLTLLVISVILFPVFILWERRLEKMATRPPLFKLSIFNSRVYSAAQIISFLFWAAFNNFLVFATYFYQDYQGLDVLQTTLRFLPSGITGLITVYISSQILSHVDGYPVAIWGTACVTVACLLFAVPIPPDTTYWAYGFPAMVLLTLGGDTLFPCLSLFVMKSIPDEDQAMGAAILQTISQVGRSIGLVLATAIQIAVIGNYEENNSPTKQGLLMGYRAAGWFNFAVGIIAIIVTSYAFRGAGKLGK